MAFRSSSDSSGWDAMAPSKLPAITLMMETFEPDGPTFSLLSYCIVVPQINRFHGDDILPHGFVAEMTRTEKKVSDLCLLQRCHVLLRSLLGIHIFDFNNRV
jgi:hypothetical protein